MAIDFELTIQYPAEFYPQGDDMLIKLLGEEHAGDSGMGFGWRDNHFNYDSADEAKAAAAKLEALNLPHVWDIEFWDWDNEERDEDWHGLIANGAKRETECDMEAWV